VHKVAFWEVECQRALTDFESGSVARWVILERDNDSRLIGRINFTQIARGPFQSCLLGYSLDAEFEGRGLMSEALATTIAHAFGELGLHRIQASYQPENVRSARLLAARLRARRPGAQLSVH
jgi:ribosomal-protein-alanine N-acetyltransferase